MPLETPSRIVQALADRGYNADREAVTLIASAADPPRAFAAAVDQAPDDALRLTVDHVRAVLDGVGAADAPTVIPDAAPTEAADGSATSGTESAPTGAHEDADQERAGLNAPGAPTDAPSPSAPGPERNPSVSSGDEPTPNTESSEGSPPETKGSRAVDTRKNAAGSTEQSPSITTEPTTPGTSTPGTATTDPSAAGMSTSESSTSEPSTPTSTPTVETAVADQAAGWAGRDPDLSARSLEVSGDVTGRSTGTGEYDQFVRTFRDRYERLSKLLRGRVNHRPASAIQGMAGGSEAEMIGLVNDVRSTANGHWLVELEDTTGTFPCLVMKDRDIADRVEELLLDECVAVQGTLSDDAGIMFVDAMHVPDVPRTHRPTTADRHVQAALVSDIHVGSQEFHAAAWQRFADWLHTEEARHVEYLLIAGDMVEGVGVYPDQDDELDIVDIYDQYETFAEHLKEVPGDLDVVMIPGNHDAVRLAEPQPGFDEELRGIMSAHDPHITGNPSTVTIEGVSILLYHGVSLDEVIAELPAETASYDEPHKAMYQLLRKRHVAPQYGGHMRLAPEERDYLVIESVPDVFHTGHVHKLGWGKYHNVLAVNSGCWQKQTAFQRSVNIDPDVGYAPILDLDTLDMTVRKFT